MSESYLVSGTVIYYELCGCEFCEGHKSKWVVGQTTILADTPEDALKLVLESVMIPNESMDQDAHWDDKNPPSVILYREELFMRIKKAPELLLETSAKEEV